MNIKKLILLISVAILAILISSCEGPQGNSGTNGLDGTNGIDGTNGTNGNMDVTMYMFTGHDFSATDDASRLIPGFTSEEQVEQGNFLVELVYDNPSSNLYYEIPGPGINKDSKYRKYKQWDSLEESAKIWIKKYEGTGEEYIGINITYFPPGSIVDYRAASTSTFEDLVKAEALPEVALVVDLR